MRFLDDAMRRLNEEFDFGGKFGFIGDDRHAYYFENERYEIKVAKDDHYVWFKATGGEDWYEADYLFEK